MGKSGVIELAENNLVRKLHEKPSSPSSNWFCPPFYFLLSSALEKVNQFLVTGNEKDAPGHFISYLVHREEVFAVKIHSSRFDIGAMDSYEQANRVLANEPVIKSADLDTG